MTLPTQPLVHQEFVEPAFNTRQGVGARNDIKLMLVLKFAIQKKDHINLTHPPLKLAHFCCTSSGEHY
jgi:hypothetical protein